MKRMIVGLFFMLLWNSALQAQPQGLEMRGLALFTRVLIKLYKSTPSPQLVLWLLGAGQFLVFSMLPWPSVNNIAVAKTSDGSVETLRTTEVL